MPGYPDIISELERQYDLDEKYIRSLPLCDSCGERITEEHCYLIRGELYCEDCVREFRVLTDNFVG